MNQSSSIDSASFAHLKGPFLALVVLFFAIFVGLRFYELNVRVLHNDESVNAWFLTKLVKSNDYKYDPENYHGPSLYYMHLVPAWVSTFVQTGPVKFKLNDPIGINDWSIRIPTAITGLLILVGLLLTSNRIGPWGALSAFILAGFSCNNIYFSRYFIHETFFVLFTFWIYLGATWYRDTRKAIFFYLMALGVGMVFCTKETSIITYFILGFSGVCAEVTYSLISRLKTTPLSVALERSFRWFFDGFFRKHAPALALMVVLWFLLYSSFFKNFGGLADSIKTYVKWTHEGVTSGHAKPFYYFIAQVLTPYELGLVLLSSAGLVFSFLKNDRRGLYLSFWTMGMVGAYSVIPYKTVWCVINLLLPMALLSGYAVQSAVGTIRESPLLHKAAMYAGLAVLVGYLSLFQIRQSLNVVFVNYDKEYFEPPYVHTSRDALNLIKEIRRLADLSRMGKAIRLNVVAEIYWPVPYYLRDFTQAYFWGKIQNQNELDAPLILASRKEEAELDALVKDRYVKKEYSLRPGTATILYINTSNAFKDDFPPPPPLPKILPAIPREGTLTVGLMKSLFNDRRAAGDPAEVSLDIRPLNFAWQSEEEKPLFSPFAIQWTGFIDVPSTGDYGMILESDDGSELRIDDFLVVDNGGTHAVKKKAGRVVLEKGLHKVQIDYFDSAGGASLRWSWAKPGEGEELVPATVLFHHER